MPLKKGVTPSLPNNASYWLLFFLKSFSFFRELWGVEEGVTDYPYCLHFQSSKSDKVITFANDF